VVFVWLTVNMRSRLYVIVHPCVCAIPRAATLCSAGCCCRGGSVHLQLAMLLLAAGVSLCAAQGNTQPVLA
jgi:hypothetical protein